MNIPPGDSKSKGPVLVLAVLSAGLILAPFGISFFADRCFLAKPEPAVLYLEGLGILTALLSVVLALAARNYRVLVLVAVATAVTLTFISSFLRTDCGSVNEAAAVFHIRTINTAQVTYSSNNGGKYGALPELVAAGLLDDRFVSEQGIGGYHFSISVGPQSYTAYATPDLGRTSDPDGKFGYFSSEDAVVHYSTTVTLAPEGQAGQPVQ